MFIKSPLSQTNKSAIQKQGREITEVYIKSLPCQISTLVTLQSNP